MQPHRQPQNYQSQPQPQHNHPQTQQVPVQQYAAQPGTVVVQRQSGSGAGIIIAVIIIVVIVVIGLVVLSGVLYVWSNSLAADQPESGTRNSYAADDANADTTNGVYDQLISIRWQHAEDDLNWAFVVMKLSVGDNTYDCAPDSSQECTIGQDGYDDSVWETGEFLILSESGSDIAGAYGATSIDIFVTYRGTAVAGDDYVTVS